MHTIGTALIKDLVNECSHGVGWGFNPSKEKGCQREDWSTLGFGWIYHALTSQYEAPTVLVIGSGRGFSAACFALADQPANPCRVVLVDPGYAAWEVDAGVQDTAAAFWKSPEQAEAHFSKNLQLTNIELVKMTAEEAISNFRDKMCRFDIIYLDANHSYKHVLRDLADAVDLLKEDGLMLAHDAHCPSWPGVALAVEHFLIMHSEMNGITLPQEPGLAILQRQVPLITIQRATTVQNDLINCWRRKESVTERPLPDSSDPQPQVAQADHRCGLFSVFLNEEVIAGFGMRHRTFSADGPDDFTPDNGKMLTGLLCYGVVVREDYRARGIWRSIILEQLRHVGDAGFIVLTSHELPHRDMPYMVSRVGATPDHTAFLIQPAKQAPPRQRSMTQHRRNLISELKTATKTITGMAQEIQQQQAETREQRLDLEKFKRDYESISESILWRCLGPLRWILDRLHDTHRSRM